MKASRLIPYLAVLSAACTAAIPAEAGVIFSTDGNPMPGFDSSPTAYGAFANPGGDAEAARFVAALSGILDHIEVAVLDGNGGGFTGTFELRLDSSGTPGTVIDTFTVNILSTSTLVSALSTSNPSIVSGQTYWLEDEIPPQDVIGVDLSSPGVSGTVLGSSKTNNGPWQTACPACGGLLPAFSLVSQDAVVPEPGTAPRFTVGAIGLLMLRRETLRRRSSGC
jgi:hypothetical protein